MNDGVELQRQHPVPFPFKVQELEDTSRFGLFGRVESGSKLMNFPFNNICQFIWDTQEGGMTGI